MDKLNFIAIKHFNMMTTRQQGCGKLPRACCEMRVGCRCPLFAPCGCHTRAGWLGAVFGVSRRYLLLRHCRPSITREEISRAGVVPARLSTNTIPVIPVTAHHSLLQVCWGSSLVLLQDCSQW